MKRVLVLFMVLVLAALAAGCKDVPPSPVPPPTATPVSSSASPPERPVNAYDLAGLSPDELLAYLDREIARFPRVHDDAGRTALAVQIEMVAREVRGASSSNPGRRAHASWRAAQAYQRAGDTDMSLAWIKPALLDSLEAGMVVLEPPPHAFEIEDISGEVSAQADFDGDGADEWVVWLRFSTSPHASIVLAVETAGGGRYAVMPIVGDWPQVGARGTLLVEAADDVNQDGLPEVVISVYSCPHTGCEGAILALGWRDGAFVDLTDDGYEGRGIALTHGAEWNISDVDDDGMVEITVLANRADTFGWGCEWEEGTMYEWRASAGVYAPDESPPALLQHLSDPRCVMVAADQSIEGGDYQVAVMRLTALVEAAPDTLLAYGMDFQAFAQFRRGVAYALYGRPGEAIGDMQAARRGPFMEGLVNAFLDYYNDGETFPTACAATAYYAVTTDEPYDLAPVIYGQLSPARVCDDQGAVQALVEDTDWNTLSPLADQLDAAGVPMVRYEEISIDADPEPEAFALTRTDFPYLWLFDAQPDGSIKPQRVASIKQALAMDVQVYDVDGDAAPEAFVTVQVRDPIGARCAGPDPATRLYVFQLDETGRVDTALPSPGYVLDCRPPETLNAALAANPREINASNNAGSIVPVNYSYRWTNGGYVEVMLTPEPGLGGTPHYIHPTGDERTQLTQVKDEMLERGDLATAWALLDPLVNLPPDGTEPAFQYEARYLLGQWLELNGEADAARTAYYNLWSDAPGSPWGQLARTRLEGR